MAIYLTCEKKRNAPRMDVRVCEHKCEQKGKCQQFQGYLKSLVELSAPETKLLGVSLPK
jgi:hypothetical protein